jgi:hypothetical protein
MMAFLTAGLFPAGVFSPRLLPVWIAGRRLAVIFAIKREPVQQQSHQEE